MIFLSSNNCITFPTLLEKHFLPLLMRSQLRVFVVKSRNSVNYWPCLPQPFSCLTQVFSNFHLSPHQSMNKSILAIAVLVQLREHMVRSTERKDYDAQI